MSAVIRLVPTRPLQLDIETPREVAAHVDVQVESLRAAVYRARRDGRLPDDAAIWAAADRARLQGTGRAAATPPRASVT